MIPFDASNDEEEEEEEEASPGLASQEHHGWNKGVAMELSFRWAHGSSSAGAAEAAAAAAVDAAAAVEIAAAAAALSCEFASLWEPVGGS